MADRASERDSSAAQSTGNKENIDFLFISPPTLCFSPNLSSPNQSAVITNPAFHHSANDLQGKRKISVSLSAPRHELPANCRTSESPQSSRTSSDLRSFPKLRKIACLAPKWPQPRSLLRASRPVPINDITQAPSPLESELLPTGSPTLAAPLLLDKDWLPANYFC